METKVHQLKLKNNIPAGIIEGTEAFWHEGEKWLIHNGTVMKFEDAPIKLKNMIAMAFLKDKKSRSYLNKIGCTSFSKGMDLWYKCVIGALDQVPDLVNGKLIADAYNSSCADYDCPHRGKFCSTGPGLKNYEVATISALKAGFTLQQTASLLCVSLPGLKSRIEKIKEKLNAPNMAALIARGSELGI